MRNEKLLTRAFNIIVVLAISTILITAVVLLYRAFEKSIRVEIFNYTREMEGSVRRTAGSEYRRYLLLLDMGKAIDTGESDDEIVTQLQEKAELFSSGSNFSDLVVSIGYFVEGSPETAREYRFNEETWVEKPDLFTRNNPELDRDNRFLNFESENGDTYLLVETLNGDYIVFFRLDRYGFVDSYLLNTLRSTYTEFSVEMVRIENRDKRKDFAEQFRTSLDEYRFRPFRILTGSDKNNQPLIVEMPGLIEIRRFMGDDGPVDTPQRGEKPEPPSIFNSGLYIKMIHEKGSFFYDIERRGAVNFFETAFIFIIVGILFMLLLFQLQRTRMLRRKEREFVASVTHELRTPLTVIRSAADNISTGIVPADRLQVYSGLIIDQSERLQNMIEEILIYSQFEEKNRKAEKPVHIDFSGFFSGLKPPLDAMVQSTGIQLIWDIKGLPETAEGYPDVLILVVNNLVTNAVTHAYPDRKGDIRICFRYLIPDKLRVTVEDDGRGIESHELKAIFQPFYRDSLSKRRQEKGSGLGLFIAKGKAETTGGKLTVESPYRRIDGSSPSGTRFTLLLPCIPAESTKTEQADG